MTLSAIVAMDNNRLIGKNDQLPWHLPADLRYFKQTTMGKPVIMGRKTYESIGKPLPGRDNIILTQQIDYQAPHCLVVHRLADALALPVIQQAEESFIIGGVHVYQSALAFCDRLYITFINGEFDGDMFFPDVDLSQWNEVSREVFHADQENNADLFFVVYEKRFLAG